MLNVVFLRRLSGASIQQKRINYSRHGTHCFDHQKVVFDIKQILKLKNSMTCLHSTPITSKLFLQHLLHVKSIAPVLMLLLFLTGWPQQAFHSA